MDRRDFVKVCAGGTALALANWDSLVLAGGFEAFPAAKLTNKIGIPLKATEIPTGEALVFSYPVAGVPCFLINLGKKTTKPKPGLRGESDEYNWAGGVGPHGQFVAYVGICTHQLSYPTQEVSFLRYAVDGSSVADAPNRIVCCAHSSVFDPVEGGRPVGGPATFPLLPVRLAYDPVSDEISADGIIGMEFIKRFMKTYKRDLIAKYGPGGYLQPVEGKAIAMPLSQYSEVVPAC
ncbi:MAG: Rieske 2Fe-2S domain-containing protein [Gallionellaceae bacterium]|nr:Rieske 2Fe-2S domain-containing protein [Gallionellaceae bacterium]